MKRSIKQFLYISAAFAAGLSAQACRENFTLPSENVPTTGTVCFDNFYITLSDDVQVEVTTKGGAEATGDYRVVITDSEQESVFSGTYSEVKATGYGVELKAGLYTLYVSSADLPAASFENPVYGALEGFEVKAGQKTSLGSVNCTIQQCAATVSYSEDLLEMMTGDGSSTIEVTAGYPLVYGVKYSTDSVSFDRRVGYFAVPSESCTMVVTFSGYLDGKQQKMTKQLGGIKVGELHNITFIKKVDPEGNVTFDVTIDSYVQDAELSSLMQASLLPVIGEDPDAPKGDGGIKLEFHPECTQYTDLDNIVVTPNGQPFDLRLIATVPNGVKSLKALIESTSKGFMDAVNAAGGPLIDLVNPSEESAIIFQVVPFPHGPELVGQTQVDFNLSSAQEPINLFPGTHTFTMKVVDQKGCKKDIAIKMIVLE